MKVSVNVYGYLSQLTVLISQVAVVAITSRKVSIFELGLYAMAQSLIGIVNFALPAGIARSLQKYQDDTAKHAKTDLLLVYFLVLFLFIETFLAWGIYLIWGTWSRVPLPLLFLVIAGFISVFNLINQFLISYVRVYRSIRLSFVIEAITGFALLAGVSSAMMIQPNILSLLVANAFTQLSILIGLIFYSLRISSMTAGKVSREEFWSRIRSLMPFAYKVSAITFISYLIYQIPVLFIGSHGGVSEVSEYARALLFCNIPLTILFTVFSRIHYMKIARHSRVDAFQFFKESATSILLFANSMFFTIAILSPFIIEVFLGNRWTLASEVLALASLGAAVQFAISIYLMRLEVRGRFAEILILTIVQGITTFFVVEQYRSNKIPLTWVFPIPILLIGVIVLFRFLRSLQKSELVELLSPLTLMFSQYFAILLISKTLSSAPKYILVVFMLSILVSNWRSTTKKAMKRKE